jgi:hypothetical protein
MRRELKYLVPEADRERLLARIAPYLGSDAHAERRGAGPPSYTVRSVYLDTPDLRDYHEKESGILRRRKLRIRGYDTPTNAGVFLEVKHKNGSAVWKDRTLVPAPVAARLVAGDPVAGLGLSVAAERSAASFVYRLRRECRRPVLLVTYDREPLVGRLDPSLRVTLDRRLRCAAYPELSDDLGGLYDERRLRQVLPGQFILEVKFDRVYPSWFRSLVGAFGLRRQALSKYGMGLAHQAAGPARMAFESGGPALRASRLPTVANAHA